MAILSNGYLTNMGYLRVNYQDTSPDFAIILYADSYIDTLLRISPVYLPPKSIIFYDNE